jgi:peptidoglycan-associated lipoprotein
VRSKRLYAFAVLAFVGVACHAKPPAATPTQPAAPAAAPSRPPAPPPPPPAAARPPQSALSDQELFERKSVDQLNAEHPLSDAFFDYDQTALREDARRALQQDADWLRKWPTTKVMIEGHCDERGSAEYNLGLGDRRAQTVTKYLESLGVGESRIVLRSVGKEAPFCTGNGEPCWSQNRRGHFLITAK